MYEKETVHFLKGYSDQPIPFRRRDRISEEAAALRQIREEEETPQKIREMKALYYNLDRATHSDSSLFYEQAVFMKDYTDNYSFHGYFQRYFPTYHAMNTEQLRGYFSFRTRLRKGKPDENPPISYVYVYAYELINGIGAEPEEGLQELERLQDLYGYLDVSLKGYLYNWIRDYIVYYGLDRTQAKRYFDTESGDALGVLLQCESNPDVGTEEEKLFQAIVSLSSYEIPKSSFYKKHPEMMQQVICRTYLEMSEYMRKEGKMMYSEKCFGRGDVGSYRMFRSAMFYDHKKYEDYLYEVSPALRFYCRKGQWTREDYAGIAKKSGILADLCRETDRLLREKTNFGHPLKKKINAGAESKIAEVTIDRYLKEKNEKKKAVLTIDLSVLENIRRDAAQTRDFLLVEEDECRSDQEYIAEDRNETVNITIEKVNITQKEDDLISDQDHQSEQISIKNETKTEEKEPEESSIFNENERYLIQSLLNKVPWEAALRGQHLSVEMLVDEINDRMMDVIGDTVIEFDGSIPTLVEDYIPDLKKLLS